MTMTTQSITTSLTELQCKHALSALSTDEIHSVIDLKKLMASDLWQQLVEYATQKIFENGDATALLRLLSAFKMSKMFKGILVWYCARTGMSYQVKSGSIKFRIPEKLSISQLSIAPYLKTIKGTRADVLSILQYSGWQESPILAESP